MKEFKSKKCKICGEMFTPTSASNRICTKNHYQKCSICGAEFLWNSTSQPPATCDNKDCKRAETVRKNMEKYGVAHPMQSKEVQSHHKQAMLEKYGVESPLQSAEIKQKAIDSNFQKFGTAWALGNKDIHDKAKTTMTERYGAPTTLQSKILRDKVKQTTINRYGVDNPSKSQQVQDKMRETFNRIYGVDNPAKVPEIHAKLEATRISNNGAYFTQDMLDKAKETWLAKYGVDNPSKSPEIQQKIKDSMVEKYGVEYGTLLSSANKHTISESNRAFKQALHELGVEAEFEFALGPYRYDLHIIDTNILIEIDPTYTHNAIGNHWTDKGLDTLYHINKSKNAKEYGYRCIHVFDWDNLDNIIAMLQPKTKVNARDCRVYKLNMGCVNEFLDVHHLQGRVRGQTLALGLVKDGQLLQVMTFGQPRYDKSYDYELLRLCTRSDTVVIGGAQRLFKFATNLYELDNIISYCDLSKFTGDIYNRLGMTLIRTTAPQEVWSKGDKKITANLLRQRGYDQLFGTNYGRDKSNEVLMVENGWLPVYDCGQAVYEYKKSPQS